MVSSFCWGCLSRLHPATPRVFQTPRVIPRIAAAAPFHTSAPREAPPMKKKSKSLDQGGPKHRTSKSARIKKKKPIDKGRPPAVGERKAMRKRIVLSNTNALEVPGLHDLTAETISDPRLREKVVGLPVSMLDQLRAVEAFKPTQGWNMFRRPGMLMRKESMELGRLIEEISEKGGKKVEKRILAGDRGTGKSLHLLQAMCMAFLKNWVVITMPEAQDLTFGATPYEPLANSDPTVYLQKQATSALLTRVVTANGAVLSELHLSQPHPAFPSTLQPDLSLEQLANIGAQDRELAWPVLKALWAELNATAPAADAQGTKEFKPRPPMLVTVDGLAHWMSNSKYRTAEYEPIHAHDLALVNHFLSLLSPPSGAEPTSTLANGGLLLYSTSGSNSPTIYGFNMALKQIEARNSGIPETSSEFPRPDPYLKPDQRVLDLLNNKDIKLQELEGLSKGEARGLMEYFAQSGILREKINDNWVGEKWSLAGGGVVGELERLGRRLRAQALA